MKSTTGLATSSQATHPFASGRLAESSVASLLLLFQIKPTSLGFDLIILQGGWTMRITFHVRKYSVTIIIKETHKKDRSEKNDRHSAK